MSRYILRENFQKPAETSGTVVNISAVKVELSEQAKATKQSRTRKFKNFSKEGIESWA